MTGNTMERFAMVSENSPGFEEAVIGWTAEMSDLQPVTSIVRLEGGWDNPIFRLLLEDGGSVVLKIWKGQEGIDGALDVLERHKWLDGHGISTTVPIQFKDGSSCILNEGLGWTLMPFIPSGHLGSDESSLNSLGREMARMHRVPKSEFFPDRYRMGRSLFKEVLATENVHQKYGSFISLLGENAEFLLSGLPRDLPMGILHGDLFPDNVLGESEVVAIIDLEESFFGPCAFDLAMAFVGFGWEHGKPVPQRWEALVEGYQSIRALEEDEVSSLPDLHRYATLAIACWRFWKHNLIAPDAELGNRYEEMVDRLSVDFDFEAVFN